MSQSGGVSGMAPAVNQEPATGPWQSTLPRMSEAVELFEAGHSLRAISVKLGIAWDSVARLLDRAGVRERNNKSR